MSDFPEDFGSIVVHDAGVHVTEAPEYALVTLELVANADPRVLDVKRGQIVFRGGIFYNVIGWDDRRKALQVRRDDA